MHLKCLSNIFFLSFSPKGLENLYQLTQKQKYELKVDLLDFEGVSVYARYTAFSVESEANGYKLSVGGFINGGAGE